MLRGGNKDVDWDMDWDLGWDVSLHLGWGVQDSAVPI